MGTSGRSGRPAPRAIGLITAGLLIIGMALAVHEPVAAASPSATAVTGGSNHSCARTSDGSAWCWGHNEGGALGDGTTSDRLRPVRVTRQSGAPLAGVAAVSAGFAHTCARTSDGAAWCWGWNLRGQLGDGTNTDRYRGVRVRQVGGALLAEVTAIDAGNAHSCARTSGGAAWCWGLNVDGELGDGSQTDRVRAVRVTMAGGGGLPGVTTIDAGQFHTCARTTDGAAWCWGLNDHGQLGDGTTTERHRAVRVTRAGGGFLTGVTGISAGYEHSCARTSDGAAWCWGANLVGGLGDGTTIERHGAVRVKVVGGGPLTGVTTVQAGAYHSCARTDGKAAWCWGGNDYGQLGTGGTIARTRAVRVTRAGGDALAGVTGISTGGWHSCARTRDGAAWCWGSNLFGKLGDGTTTDRRRAVRVVATWAATP